MKRESGENPEQTRCCKLPQKSSKILDTTGELKIENSFREGISKME
jgi:hypothetical protein